MPIKDCNFSMDLGSGYDAISAVLYRLVATISMFTVAIVGYILQHSLGIQPSPNQTHLFLAWLAIFCLCSLLKTQYRCCLYS